MTSRLGIKLRSAVEEHRSGNLAAALKVYDGVLAVSPDHADALHLKGLVAFQTGVSDEAEASIRRAIELRPGEVEFRANLASVLLRQDRIDEVEQTSTVGMADFVTLKDVIFHVNGTGWRQTLENRGPLPNHRTAHAFLTGELTSISDNGQTPSKCDWSPVSFNPTVSRNFFIPSEGTSIHTASSARMTPGKAKVWIRTDDATHGIVPEVTERETAP